MTKEICLTYNFKTAWRDNDFQLLKSASEEFGYTTKILNSFDMMKEKTLPYAVYNGGGSPNETQVRYLRHCELNGVKYLNPVYATLIAEDKALSNLEIESLGFRVPKTIDLHIGLRLPHVVEIIDQELGFPCIIKHPKSAIGVGVHRVKTREEFNDLFDLLYTCSMRTLDFKNTVNLIAQEYITSTKNQDLRVFVLNDQIVGAMHRVNPIGWNVKRVEWIPGWPTDKSDIHYTFVQVSDDLADKCLKIAKHLNMKFVGLDILYGENEDEYIFGELNPNPGITNFYNLVPDINIHKKIIHNLINI